MVKLTKTGKYRTNHTSEEWNNKFTELVHINYPNIWLFIECDKTDEQLKSK